MNATMSVSYGGFTVEEIAAIRYAARKHLEGRKSARKHAHFSKRLMARKTH